VIDFVILQISNEAKNHNVFTLKKVKEDLQERLLIIIELFVGTNMQKHDDLEKKISNFSNEKHDVIAGFIIESIKLIENLANRLDRNVLLNIAVHLILHCISSLNSHFEPQENMLERSLIILRNVVYLKERIKEFKFSSLEEENLDFTQTKQTLWDLFSGEKGIRQIGIMNFLDHTVPKLHQNKKDIKLLTEGIELRAKKEFLKEASTLTTFKLVLFVSMIQRIMSLQNISEEDKKQVFTQIEADPSNKSLTFAAIHNVKTNYDETLSMIKKNLPYILKAVNDIFEGNEELKEMIKGELNLSMSNEVQKFYDSIHKEYSNELYSFLNLQNIDSIIVDCS